MLNFDNCKFTVFDYRLDYASGKVAGKQHQKVESKPSEADVLHIS